jgi:DNA-binding CsgD family transcriptional regulator
MFENLWTVCNALEQTQDDAAIWKIVSKYVAGFDVTSLVYRAVRSTGMQAQADNEAADVSVTLDGANYIEVMSIAIEKEFFNAGYDLKKLLYWKSSFDLPHIFENDNTLEDTISLKTKLAGVVFPAIAAANRKAIIAMAFKDPDRDYSQEEIFALRIVGEKAHQKLSELFFEKQRDVIQLSVREKEILTKIVDGKSNNQIAKETILSRHTVDAYIRRVFLKLGVSDRTSAAVSAVNNNLITGKNYCSASDLALKKMRELGTFINLQ